MTDSFNLGLSNQEAEIDVREAFDLHFWCEELNLKKEELVDIVKLVGPAVHDVRLHIAKKLLINWPVAY